MDEKRTVFVIMPFSGTETHDEAEWTNIYETILKPAVEACGYLCERARISTGSLIKTIVGDLRNSTIVLADITDRNPNVFYELGVRHSLSKRTIIVAQRYDDIPSDLRGYWSVIYGTRQWEVDKFKDEIKRIISEIEKDPDRSDSPVLDYLEQQEFRNRKRIEEMAIKKYKGSWERTVMEEVPEHTLSESPFGIERTLLEFEIRKTAYEIIALSDDDIGNIKHYLDFLHTVYLLEGTHKYTKEILSNLDQVAMMAGLSGGNKGCLVADRISDFFLHLPGPEKVEMDRTDADNLKAAIEIIGTIGSYSAEFSKNPEIITSVSKAIGNIWNLLVWYDLESHALLILTQIDEISKACKVVYNDEEPLTTGVKEMSKLRRKLKAITAEERPKWKEVLTRLSKKGKTK